MWYLELRGGVSDFRHSLRKVDDLDEYLDKCGDDTARSHALYRIPEELQGLAEALTTLDKASPSCGIGHLLDDLFGFVFECGGGINIPELDHRK